MSDLFDATASALEKFATKIVALRGRARAAVAFGAGVAGALSMAPIYALPLLVLSFTVLVLLIDGAKQQSKPRFRAFASGWWFGAGYFLVGVYWMAFAFLVQAEQFAWMAPFAVMFMAGGLALFFGAATALASSFWRTGFARVLIFAACFSGFEYLRGNILTGLPWNLVGQSLAGSAIGAQTAAWYGAYGLSLIAIILAALPAAGLGRAARAKKVIGWAIAPIIGASLLYAIGFIRLSSAPADLPTADVHLRIVQPNIEQRDKINPEKWSDNFFRALELSRGAAPEGGPLFIVWPENAAPLIDETYDALTILSDQLPEESVLITGAVRRQPGADGYYDYFNAISVIEGRAGHNGVIGYYDKHHLVPFGEYLPFYGLLNAVGLAQLAPYGDSGFAKGAGPATLTARNIKFSPLICYEAIFPNAIYPKHDRPRFLVTVTNDAWFGDSFGPRQHLDQARLRSIETGLPMARAANTGVSALIDSHGRIRSRISLYDAGAINTPLPPAAASPLYDQFGDWLYFILLLTVLGVALGGVKLLRAVQRLLQPLRDTSKKS